MKINMLTKTIYSILICCMLSAPAHSQATAPKIAGYIKTGFGVQDNKDGKFSVANARFKLTGAVDEQTKYTLFMDAIRDDVLLDAFVVRSITSSVAVQAGQFKTPYGDDNLLSGTAYPFVSRGYLKKSLSPAFRDIGIQFSYTMDRVSACAAVLNGTGPNKSEVNNNKNMVYRVSGIILPGMNVSGNYCCGDTANDGSLTEYYDAGVGGKCKHALYGCECACKRHKSVKSIGVAGWVSYDIPSRFDSISFFTPAVKYEYYDADNDKDNDCVCCYTLGVATHIGSKNSNRIMINYVLNDYESTDSEDSVSIEYMVRY